MPAPDRGRVWELDEVRTIMHVPEAQRAIEDGMISSRLVYDESKLNTHRLPVVWTSANTWSEGSFYGTVEFVFPWKDLVAGKVFYWVEVIHKYSPPAYRILVVPPGSPVPGKVVQHYDPRTDHGPIRLDGATWYWNAAATSEVMFAEDLSLDRLSKIGFINHHHTICRYGSSSCTERKLGSFKAGGRVLAHILAKGLHSVDEYLSPERNHGLGMNFDLNHGVSGFWFALTKEADRIGTMTDPAAAVIVMRGALALFAMGRTDDAIAISGSIAKKRDREAALKRIVSNHFGVKDLVPA
ncbi:hypothetical protein ASG47_07000 [Devosia sp. Leaf420]|nr:hypothetical protein ASG47_07000 [Devosia sp. Leaf420]